MEHQQPSKFWTRFTLNNINVHVIYKSNVIAFTSIKSIKFAGIKFGAKKARLGHNVHDYFAF